MRLKRINIILLLVLFISVGFAVLTSNLSINGIASFSDASFDVHFENASVSDESVEGGNIVINDGNVSINITGSFEKPGDYINTSFYVINSGTMDATLNTFSISGINSTYFTSTMKYDIDGTNVAKGNILRAGQGRKINFHLEYKYDVDQLTTATSLNATVTMNYINPKKVTSTTVWDYEYTGGEQTFYVNKAGNYKIELWGAQGGGTTESSKGVSLGGLGGYTSGIINLTKNTRLYIYVGEFGKTFTLDNFSDTNLYNSTFNGGGKGGFDTNESGTLGEHGFPGGGATDVRLVAGEWNEFESLMSRIMVAAGGGGGGWSGNGSNDQYYVGGGGYGGGLSGLVPIGKPSSSATIAGSQTSGASFGIGGNSVFWHGINNNATGAGGGGYYGGQAGLLFAKSNSSGAGGSSFISGHAGCNAIDKSSIPTSIVHTGLANHYSNYIFNNTVIIDGGGYSWTTVAASESTGMPTHDGTGTMTGNTGNGYAKITYLGK